MRATRRRPTCSRPFRRWCTPDLRIARPAIRDGWREGKPRTGADTFHEVSWDEALAAVAGEVARVRASFSNGTILGGSYGWSSAGRLPCPQPAPAFLFLGGGCVDQVGNYSFGAAQYILPRVIGTFQPVVGEITDWSSIVKHTRLILAFGRLATKNGQVTSGGAGAHSLETWLRRAKDAGIEFVSHEPAQVDAPEFLGAQWILIGPNTDTALMLAMAHTLLNEDRHDAQFVALCAGFERFRRYPARPRRRRGEGRGMGGSDHRRRRRDDRALARRAAAMHQHDHLRVVAAARTTVSSRYWASIVLAAMLGGSGFPAAASRSATARPTASACRASTCGTRVPLPLNPRAR